MVDFRFFAKRPIGSRDGARLGRHGFGLLAAPSAVGFGDARIRFAPMRYKLLHP